MNLGILLLGLLTDPMKTHALFTNLSFPSLLQLLLIPPIFRVLENIISSSHVQPVTLVLNISHSSGIASNIVLKTRLFGRNLFNRVFFWLFTRLYLGNRLVLTRMHKLIKRIFLNFMLKLLHLLLLRFHQVI